MSDTKQLEQGRQIQEKILSDAKAEADAILAKGQAEAKAILEAARQKAQKETEKTMALYATEAQKAKSKEISAADMQAKKQVLAKKQQLIEEVMQEAKEKLHSLSETEYKVVLIGMLDQAQVAEGAELIFSEQDKAAFGADIASRGYTISEETRELDGGFVVKEGDIEYNYSFSSILTVEKEQLEQTAAQILFF